MHLEITDSTNLQARRLASQFPFECVLVTAGEQTAGRGRQGRHWASPRGGAWMSLAWPMRNQPCTYVAASLAAAVAVLRAVSDVAPECADGLKVKWPNDLILNGRKVAGILCEQVLNATTQSRGTLIIGVGVNVDFDVALLPQDLRHPATTLRRESNRPVTVDHVVNSVAARLIQLVSEFEVGGLSDSVFQELQSRLAYIGSVRSFEVAGQTTTGRISGIDRMGRLMIQSVEGDMVFTAGELLGNEGDAD